MKSRNDTPKSVRRKYRAMIMAQSGIDRLRSASTMFGMMVSFATANLEARGYAGSRLKAELALRLYGRGMRKEQRQKMYAHFLALSDA